MKDIIINVLKEFGEMKFTSVVTDNASNMKAAWNLIQSYYPHISCYGCVAHGLNLLVQDITIGLESLKEVVVELKHVIKEIKNKHILLSVLKEKQSLLSGNLPSLKLPGATRWGSIVRSMHSLIDNKSCLKAMCIDERVELTVTQQTKNCILMDVFWERIETFYKLLKPLAHYLKLVQGDKLNLSIVCTIFSELEKDFKEFISLEIEPALKNEELKILAMLENRRDFCLKKIHLAANILDPNTFGKDLKDGEDIEAIEFIINMGENNADIEINNLISQIAQYRSKEGIFNKEFLWKTLDSKLNPLIWWKGFCSNSAAELAKIAIKILSSPPTSASVERSFSKMGHIQNLKRNRLDNERASKLLFIAHNKNLFKNYNTDEVQLKKVTASSNVVLEYYDENQMITYSSTPLKKSRNAGLDDTELHIENQLIMSASSSSNYPRQPKRKSPNKIIDLTDLSDTRIEKMLADDDKSFSSIEESDCGSEWKSSDENVEDFSFEVDNESTTDDLL